MICQLPCDIPDGDASAPWRPVRAQAQDLEREGPEEQADEREPGADKGAGADAVGGEVHREQHDRGRERRKARGK